jgi:beta-barrel assembly-enhancing protease
MLSKKIMLTLAITVSLTAWNCGGLKNINLFTVQDDIELGKQFSQQIESDSKQFPILPEKGNEEAYKYIRGLTQKLLRTGKVAHANEFAWEVKIIKDDETLNAFAVPGGYLYVYTGLIKFLDTEDQLAGVMGHEIAHAALRHSTQQMTKIYGLDALRQIITGKTDPGLLEQIALGLVSLKFSRTHESQADEHSVIYLCGTNLKANGAAGFFEKIQGKGGTPPEFLSTHPDPGNRVKDINAKAQSLGCTGNDRNQSEYDRIKKLLK